MKRKIIYKLVWFTIFLWLVMSSLCFVWFLEMIDMNDNRNFQNLYYMSQDDDFNITDYGTFYYETMHFTNGWGVYEGSRVYHFWLYSELSSLAILGIYTLYLFLSDAKVNK